MATEPATNLQVEGIVLSKKVTNLLLVKTGSLRKKKVSSERKEIFAPSP